MFGSACSNRPGGGFGAGAHPLMQFLQQKKGFGGHCDGPGAILKALGLTDEQLERVAELKVSGLGQCAQFKSVSSELVPKLAKELSQDSIDRNKVNDVYQQIKAQKSELGDAMLSKIISFAEVLTPEQRKKARLTAIKCFLGLNQGDEG